MISTFSTVLLLAIALISQPVNAHSFLSSPVSALRSPVPTFCQTGSTKTTCCAPRSAAHPGKTTYKRGEVVPFSWPRNNHPGGFIRMSVSPFATSDDQKVFDANTIMYTCHETDCHGYDPKNPFSGDKNGAIPNSNPCHSKFTLPSYLADGQYTIQWAWIGGSSFFNDIKKGQASYQSCMDFTVKGGSSLVAKSGSCPTFIGGDASFPGQNKCSVFLPTGKLDATVLGCFPDGCQGTHSSGQPLEIKQCKTPGLLTPLKSNQTKTSAAKSVSYFAGKNSSTLKKGKKNEGKKPNPTQK